MYMRYIRVTTVDGTIYERCTLLGVDNGGDYGMNFTFLPHGENSSVYLNEEEIEVIHWYER